MDRREGFGPEGEVRESGLLAWDGVPGNSGTALEEGFAGKLLHPAKRCVVGSRKTLNQRRRCIKVNWRNVRVEEGYLPVIPTVVTRRVDREYGC